MVLKNELNKFLFKQNGILLLIICLIFESIFCFYKIRSSDNFLTKTDNKIYKEYMTYLNGEMTSEKEEFIINENNKIEESKNKYQYIISRLSNGEIDENEYLKRYEFLSEDLEKENAFKRIWEKYKYVKLNEQERYFIGSDVIFLSHDRIDYVMMLIVSILILNFLFIEKETNMLNFIKISKKGGILTAFIKWEIIVLFTMFLILFTTCIEFFSIMSYLDSEFLKYPIQSLEFYSQSPYKFTIGELWFYTTILKCFGFVGFASVIIILEEIIKNKLITLFIPTTILFLQELMFENKAWIYKFPFPSNLIRAIGYFRGDAKTTLFKGSAVEETKILFENIPYEYIVIMILFSVTLSIGSLIVLSNSYKNKRKKLKIGLAYFFVAIILTSCGNIEESKDNIYNQNISKNFLINQNETSYIVKKFNDIIMFNKKDGDETILNRNPFSKFDEKTLKMDVFLDENNYYINYGNKNVDLKYINLNDFSEKNLYQENIKKRDYFLNLYRDNSIRDKECSIWNFFVKNDNLYLILFDSRVIKIDMHNNKKTVVIDDGIFNGNISFDGQNIYYINDKLTLKRYDINKDELSTVIDKKIRYLYLYSKEILCSDRNGLYIVNKDTKDIKFVVNDFIEEVSCDENYIYYTKVNDLKLYKISKLGGAEKVICDEEVVKFEVISGTKYIYCQIDNCGNQEYKLINKNPKN